MRDKAFAEYDVFVLARELADKSVPIGTHGVVLLVFDGDFRAYEVEFPDGNGGNLGNSLTYTLTDDDMAAVSST
jgi:hypothetical protein